MPMGHVQPRTAEYYRGKAAEIRFFARRTKSPEVARELLDFAHRLDCMATCAERRAPCPAVHTGISLSLERAECTRSSLIDGTP
jgi:hypothetical protein